MLINPVIQIEENIHHIDQVSEKEQLKSQIILAREAQKFWAKLSIDDRITHMTKLRNYIIENIDELAQIISSDNGKTRTDALITELLPAAMGISYYMDHAHQFLKDKKLSPGHLALANKKSTITRVPYGVIGVISPWNYPFAIPFSEVIMALIAGNAVVLKVATETRLVGLALEKAMQAAELPDGLFTLVEMPGRVAGDAFLESGVNKLFFTGSVRVGKILMKKAAETLTPVSLELGGNDAMIVCADADPLRAAAGAAWAGFQNAGQSCGGVERIYVHEEIYDSFLAELKKIVESLRIGVDDEFNVDMGSMTTLRQKDSVVAHVEDALKKGAQIFIQSSIPELNDQDKFLPAMVLTQVNHNMRIMKEETFGPVVGVMKVKSDEEAISLANDSNLGLTASVWTKNWKKAEKIAQQIEAGAVNINDHLMSHGLPETPWGGFKESSIGRSHGEIGFDEMTQPQVIIKDVLPFVKKNMWWYPFDEKVYSGLKGLLDLFYAPNMRRRLNGAFRIMRLAPKMFVS